MIKPLDRKSGFTLTELLVVILIILLLAAVLVPTVNRLRDSASATGCASNMRQCISLSLMFASEQNGRLPRLYVHGIRMTSEVGKSALPKEERIIENPQVWWPDLITTYAEGGSMIACPKLKGTTSQGMGGAKSKLSPLGIGINYASLAPAGSAEDGSHVWVRLSSVPDQGRLVWFADAAAAPGGGDLTGKVADRKEVAKTGSCFFRGHLADAPCVIPRHGGKINVGFLDGHVALVKPSEINWGTTDTSRKYVGFTKFP